MEQQSLNVVFSAAMLKLCRHEPVDVTELVLCSRVICWGQKVKTIQICANSDFSLAAEQQNGCAFGNWSLSLAEVAITYVLLSLYSQFTLLLASMLTSSFAFPQ